MSSNLGNIISIVEQYTNNEVTLESDFYSDLRLDSLDVVELIMDVEESFGVVLDDDDAERIKTVKDLHTAIQIAIDNVQLV